MHIDYQARLTAVRQRLDKWQVEGVLINSAANRRWLSGFTGSNAQLLITQKKALIATDFRYYAQATKQASLFTLFKHERTQADTKKFIATAGVSRIGLEAAHITLAQSTKFEAIEGITWVPLDETIEPLRAIKTAVEHRQIRAAAAITDRVMAQVNAFVRPDMTEKELDWQLEKMIHEAGADALAFPVTVASGPNAALPHHQPGDRHLQEGDTIIVDMGTALGGYKSDLTRSFYLGNEPTTQFWQVYELVLAGHTAVFEQLKPGMSLKAIDALARDLIHGAGHEAHFGHGLGHGVGLEVHEDPFLSPKAEEDETIAVGMNVTIEPGIYIPDWGGVRIEDLALVTENGLEMISQCPKNPIIQIR
jgi:Xaa-Pro aminopeptidase